MAESRRKSHSILLSADGKTIASLELFPADQWPEKTSIEGLYRVRVDGQWYTPNGKYSFLPMTAVAELTARLMAGDGPIISEPEPDLDRHQKVMVRKGICLETLPLEAEIGWTAAPAHLGPDGRWYVWVQLADGLEIFPAHDVERI